MRTKIIFLCLIMTLLMPLCACKIHSNKPISDKVLNDRKEAFEEYLKETYPDETFTVKVWQEYGTDIGGAGLPDYEGYLIRQVIIDSDGNKFQIHDYGNGEYSDDRQKVLDGWIEYDDKGELILSTDRE
ncbi:MAG: hypothetical protein K5659_06445 [Lachnospiraceae bacterium]|nr:hypothetical protein [Lachnospiraceae bacterium]